MKLTLRNAAGRVKQSVKQFPCWYTGRILDGFSWQTGKILEQFKINIFVNIKISCVE